MEIEEGKIIVPPGSRLWYPNRSKECFSTSLANLLVGGKNYDCAFKVFNNYRKHPLIASDGLSYFFVATRLVTELTEGSYKATLSTKEKPGPAKTTVDKMAIDFWGNKWEEIVKVWDEEEKAGRIVYEDEFKILDLCMLAIKNNDEYHWLVQDRPFYIDNGRMKRYKEESIWKITGGVLHVRPCWED